MALSEAPKHTGLGISLGPELAGVDICAGADPFLFKRDNNWHLLLQGNLDSNPTAHRGLKGYTIRTAPTIETLPQASPIALDVPIDNTLTQSWAGEIDGNFLYVAQSAEGDNRTHRIRVYGTEQGVVGPWMDLGQIDAPADDDSWAIDLTSVDIKGPDGVEPYAIWSGWQNPDDEFPQNIYIAKKETPTKLGPRRLIAAPTIPWCCSVKPILEGPQAIVLDGQFKGLTVAANASWTDEYSTGILKYKGDDPLEPASWEMVPEPLLPPLKGIGHGMIVEDLGRMFYVGHRKTTRSGGWEDRAIFYTEIDKQRIGNLLT